jgi:acetoin utilization deacetylase AcuC-like enzyme
MSEKLIYYYPEGHQAHFAPQHPEKPERVEHIRRSLIKAGFWDPYQKINSINLSTEDLFEIHDPTYLKKLQKACAAGQWYDQDTYLTPDSYQIALQTAGGAIAVSRSVWTGAAETGFALCRPPGHHATRAQAMGFCLINNIAVAAQDLLQTAGANRVAILDFDLHHGNGTQDIFWERGDVFYFSTHQWPLYPGTGRLEEQGAGAGFGKTANFPLPPGTGDDGFETIFTEIILPLLADYAPEMLLVSIGFDPHWMDPLGFLQLTATGYGLLIRQLKVWAADHCQGRIALILEGGYNLQAIEVCSQSVVAALLDQEFTDTLGNSPYPPTERWKSVALQSKKLWKL